LTKYMIPNALDSVIVFLRGNSPVLNSSFGYKTRYSPHPVYFL